MSHWIADSLALASSCLALFFIFRLKNTYFLDPRFFIGLANLGFTITLLQYVISDFSGIPLPITGYVLLTALMGASIGVAAFLLERDAKSPGMKDLAAFLSHPPKRFLGFLTILTAWTLSSIFAQPQAFQLHTILGQEGPTYYYTYPAWWQVLSLAFLVSFLAGPILSLLRQSFSVRDQKVVGSTRMLSLSFTGFAIVAFINGALGANSPLVQSALSLLDSLFFVIAAVALREPTILSRIISTRIMSNSLHRSSMVSNTTPRDQDSFSKLLNMDHKQLVGNRILLEYASTSSFEDVVLKFVRENEANSEPTVVFTSPGGPVHTVVKREGKARVFSLSVRTSTPTRISEDEVLLPAADSSLLLDAVDKLVQSYKARPVGIVLDSTDLILSQGFNKAYRILSSIIEMAHSEPVALLVMVNRDAVEERVLSGLRGLFHLQGKLGPGGLELAPLHSARPQAKEDWAEHSDSRTAQAYSD